MQITFTFIRETKNFRLYADDTMNKLYLPKTVTVLEFTIEVPSN